VVETIRKIHTPFQTSNSTARTCRATGAANFAANCARCIDRKSSKRWRYSTAQIQVAEYTATACALSAARAYFCRTVRRGYVAASAATNTFQESRTARQASSSDIGKAESFISKLAASRAGPRHTSKNPGHRSGRTSTRFGTPLPTAVCGVDNGARLAADS